MTFLIALADATFAAAFPIVYLTGTIINLRTWPPQRPVSTRKAAAAMAHRRALRVKGGWAA